AVGILDLAPALAIFGAEQVAEDGEQPRRHVRSRLERIDIGHGAQQGLLHEIVGAIHVAAKRDGERAQARYGREHRITNGWLHRHQLVPLCCDLSEPLTSTTRSDSRPSLCAAVFSPGGFCPPGGFCMLSPAGSCPPAPPSSSLRR